MEKIADRWKRSTSRFFDNHPFTLVAENCLIRLFFWPVLRLSSTSLAHHVASCGVLHDYPTMPPTFIQQIDLQNPLTVY